MLKFLSHYFYFNRRERSGIFGLFILLGLLTLSNFFINSIIPEDQEAYRQFLKELALIDSISRKQDAIQKKIQLFNFDPNHLSLESWQQLGLSLRQAQMILNYRSKGGRFYRKEDLLKIYSISDSTYALLAPYIQIKTSPSLSQKTTFLHLELNTVDTTDLKKIRGIGSVFAKRILKYRNLLGGYHSISQLLDVYGIDQEKFESIKANFIACDSTFIKQININTASFKELLKHPYISFDFTSFIVNRREEKKFTKLSQLKDDYLISDEEFKKLLPYLKLK